MIVGVKEMTVPKILVLTAIVAVALAVLLFWRSPWISRGMYRTGFLVGLVSLSAFALIPRSRPEEWSMNLPGGPLAILAVVLLTFLPLAPFVLVIEIGIAGYRGFSSWLRYV